MKTLYKNQVGRLAVQWTVNYALGWALTYPLMGPIIRAQTHTFVFRFPVALTFALFLHQQAQYKQSPNKIFHELMAQPAPHGSYLRKSLKEHFPVWFHSTSMTLAKNGYNLPEMNEYDKIKFMPKSHTKFNSMKS